MVEKLQKVGVDFFRCGIHRRFIQAFQEPPDVRAVSLTCALSVLS